MNSANLKFYFLLKRAKLIVLLLALSFLSKPIQAQISSGGKPASFRSEQFEPVENSYSPKIPFSLNKNEIDSKQAIAYEFGKILPFDHSLHEAGFGTQTVDQNGNIIWRATISSENALALALYFSDFYLPEGAELFIYSPDREQIIGSFTYLNNSETGLFATELILGDKLVIEYNEPSNVAGLGRFTINEVLHAYRGVSDLKANGFGGAGSCEVNVNCSEGANYTNQKNSVVRLLVREGTSAYWCTASVINNVKNDHTPYVLTADHCGIDATFADLNQWIFYFNYQSANCANPSVEPISKTMTGATKIAASSNSGSMGSDFYLVLLNQNIPADYNAYYMGWDRSGSTSTSGVTIHHPEGDIKKISTYTTNLISKTYSYSGAAPNGSWEVVWSATANGYGVTEGGSSGSPIYSQNGLLIGTLTGGEASCSNKTGKDYFGKFDYHWDKNGSTPATQLKPWLDPDNTGTLVLQGFSVEDDTIPPTFTVPSPVTINCGDDPNNLLLTGDVIDEWDNNPVGQATYTDVTNNSNPCAILITRTWRLVDNSNNKLEQKQTITLVDITPPTFTQPADITINMTDNPNDLLLTGDVFDEADNCDTTTLNYTYSDLRDATDIYSILITRTWTLSDHCGNTTKHDQIIRIANSFFDIFPNPSNGQITMKFDQTANGKTYTIRVANILGQSVFQNKFIVEGQLDINLQNLQNGVYFIEVTGVNQKQTRKLIIH